MSFKKFLRVVTFVEPFAMAFKIGALADPGMPDAKSQNELVKYLIKAKAPKKIIEGAMLAWKAYQADTGVTLSGIDIEKPWLIIHDVEGGTQIIIAGPDDAQLEDHVVILMMAVRRYAMHLSVPELDLWSAVEDLLIQTPTLEEVKQ